MLPECCTEKIFRYSQAAFTPLNSGEPFSFTGCQWYDNRWEKFRAEQCVSRYTF